MLCAIDNGAKDVPKLYIIMKLDVHFEWPYIAVCILHKELLHSLNKNGHACLSKNLEKSCVMFRYDLRHQNIDSFTVSVQLIWRVSKEST